MKLNLFFFIITVVFVNPIVSQKKQINQLKIIHYKSLSTINGENEYLEILTDSKESNLIYYGVELNPKKNVFYYKVKARNIPGSNYDLAVNLSNYTFYKKPSYIHKNNIQFCPTKSQIPADLLSPIMLLIKIKEDSLMVRRITSKHIFSNFESLIFFRVDSIP